MCDRSGLFPRQLTPEQAGYQLWRRREGGGLGDRGPDDGPEKHVDLSQTHEHGQHHHQKREVSEDVPPGAWEEERWVGIGS